MGCRDGSLRFWEKHTPQYDRCPLSPHVWISPSRWRRCSFSFRGREGAVSPGKGRAYLPTVLPDTLSNCLGECDVGPVFSQHGGCARGGGGLAPSWPRRKDGALSVGTFMGRTAARLHRA